jgi:hypothetical protein
MRKCCDVASTTCTIQFVAACRAHAFEPTNTLNSQSLRVHHGHNVSSMELTGQDVLAPDANVSHTVNDSCVI